MKRKKFLLALMIAAFLVPTAASCANEDAPPTTPPTTPPTAETTPPAEEEGGEDVEEIAPTPPPVAKTVEYIRCTGDSVNLRAGAGTSYSVDGNAKKVKFTPLRKNTATGIKRIIAEKRYIYLPPTARFFL